VLASHFLACFRPKKTRAAIEAQKDCFEALKELACPCDSSEMVTEI
jgi:hypothetical protein